MHGSDGDPSDDLKFEFVLISSHICCLLKKTFSSKNNDQQNQLADKPTEDRVIVIPDIRPTFDLTYLQVECPLCYLGETKEGAPSYKNSKTTY